MSTDNIEIENVRFAVLDRPVCVWAPHLADTNLRFLRGLDPDFFLNQARVYQSVLTAPDTDVRTKEATYAALALRVNYGMALEALFGLLGALLQAPDCVFGWLSTYSNAELKALVSRIAAKESLRTLPPFCPPTWEQISSVLLGPLREQDPKQHQLVSEMFVKSWRFFAADFVSEHKSREYNSLKHSFRVEPGAFSIDFNHEGTSLLQTDAPFGHSFPYLKRMPGRKNHYDVSRAVSALEPVACSAGLVVAALSINNAVAFARARAGDSADNITVRFPNDPAVFEEVWKQRAPIQSLNYGGSVTVAEAEYWTDDQILAVYDDVSVDET